jgi:hypothetical protein
VTQVVEHMPSKCEALSSNPTITKKKKKRVVVQDVFSASINKSFCFPNVPSCQDWYPSLIVYGCLGIWSLNQV